MIIEPLTKQDEHTELSDYINNTYGEQLKNNLDSEGEWQIRRYPI